MLQEALITSLNHSLEPYFRTNVIKYIEVFHYVVTHDSEHFERL